MSTGIKYCTQTEYVVQIGDNVSITCNQTGNGILWFKQYPNQRPILLDPKMKDHEHFNDGRLLTMKNIKLEDSATYYCCKRKNTEYTFGNITYIKIKGKYFSQFQYYFSNALEIYGPLN